jgi:hypothetical protein
LAIILFVLFSFFLWPIYCLSFGHYIVCSLAIVLFVLWPLYCLSVCLYIVCPMICVFRLVSSNVFFIRIRN